MAEGGGAAELLGGLAECARPGLRLLEGGAREDQLPLLAWLGSGLPLLAWRGLERAAARVRVRVTVRVTVRGRVRGHGSGFGGKVGGSGPGDEGWSCRRWPAELRRTEWGRPSAAGWASVSSARAPWSMIDSGSCSRPTTWYVGAPWVGSG